MSALYDDGQVTLYHGDALDVLRTLPAASVQCVVTSPPYYQLRDYHVEGQIGLEPTLEEYVERLVEVFREMRRVLRDDGTLWLNVGDSYATHAQARHQQPRAEQGNGRGRLDFPDQGHFDARWSTGTDKRVPQGLKDKDLIGIPWMLAFALRADGWWLRSDCIWCLSGGTRVYARTQKGEMPMSIKDMVRLDPATVQLWNGEKWTQVLGWSESDGRNGALEVELRSGQRIGTTPGHQWPTQRGLVRTDELHPGDVITATTLPEPTEPENPGAIPPAFGWFAGLYLAEGSMDSNQRIQIAGHAEQHARRLAALSFLTREYGAYVRGYVTGNKSTIVIAGPVVNAMLRLYVDGDNARDKGLKVATWRRSNAFLDQLLRGYLAGDAHYDEKNDRYRLGFTRNDRLAADLRTLCARLDLPLRLAATTATGFGETWPTYRGDVRLARSSHHNAREGGEVVTVRAGKGRKFWDIGVADHPHVFALASGVLTHNSKPNPMPESVTDRPTRAHEYLFLLSKSARYHYDAEAIREEPKTPYVMKVPDGWDTGPGAHGSFHRDGREQGQRNDKQRGHGRRHEGFDERWDSMSRDEQMALGANKRSVWTVATRGFAAAHFATFPPALIEPCILAGCPEGGVVLDPFIGSGTTAETAKRLGRRCVGIDLNEQYLRDLAIPRCRQQALFLAGGDA